MLNVVQLYFGYILGYIVRQRLFEETSFLKSIVLKYTIQHTHDSTYIPFNIYTSQHIHDSTYIRFNRYTIQHIYDSTDIRFNRYTIQHI